MPVTGFLHTFAGQPFKAVLDEWRIHLEADQEPDVFANIFLELMRDPQDAVMRQQCSMFAAYMRPRNWNTMKHDLSPMVDDGVRAAFARPNAAAFYEGFRGMVVQAVHEYWNDFLNGQRKKGPGYGPKDWSPRAKRCRADENICGDPLHRRCGRRKTS